LDLVGARTMIHPLEGQELVNRLDCSVVGGA
jgi:hypothetical protein